MLAIANIRKTKGHSFSLFIMFLIAAMLLNVGLLVTLNFGSYFNDLTKELNAADVYYMLPDSLYNDEVKEYVENNDNVQELQEIKALWASGFVKYKDTKDREFTYLFNNADENRVLSKWKFIGEHLEPEDMSIYVPYVFQVDGGYELNDKFELTIKEKVLTFTIKGFTDDIFFSSTDTGILGLYLPESTYNKVADVLNENEYKANVIFANLKVVNKDVETGIRDLLETDNASLFSDASTTFVSIDLSLISLSRTMMASMIAVMMVIFAVIIVAVCLIVVRFRISNSVEDDMMKIGSLKSIGYTSKQIMISIALQFSLIAFIGSFVGIALSYPILPYISDIFAQQSGLKWEQGFDPFLSGITLLFMLLVTVLVAYFAANKVNKLNPIDALRGDTFVKKIRKNHVPLEKTRGNLTIVLALKSVMQNMKQNIMIAIIMAVVSFAGVFSVIMCYNSTVDTSTFAEVPGIERSSIVAVLNPMMDNSDVVDEIKDSELIKKAQYIDEIKIKIEGDDITAYVMKDYEAKRTKTVYEGSYPMADNEIVLAGMLADMFDKKVGDTVTVKINDKEETFKITGLSQGANMGGLNASIRYDDLIRFNPDFKEMNLHIYVDEIDEIPNLIKSLRNDYDENMLTIIDMEKGFMEGMGSYTSIVSIVGITILIVKMFVIILVLYFVINTSVVRKKRELGIQKAIGFSTLQLMNQLSLSFLPPIFIGIVIGCILGAFETNPVMSITMGAMGIMKANFLVVPLWIVVFGILMLVVSYLTAMFITWRIRKISAYALVTE